MAKLTITTDSGIVINIYENIQEYLKNGKWFTPASARILIDELEHDIYVAINEEEMERQRKDFEW